MKFARSLLILMATISATTAASGTDYSFINLYIQTSFSRDFSRINILEYTP